MESVEIFLGQHLSLCGTRSFLFHPCCGWTRSEMRGDAGSENVLLCDPSSLPLHSYHSD